MSEILTLGFESSAKTASVALCRGKALIAQYTQTSGLTHSATLLPMAERLLESTGTALSDIDRFAVAHGPGSFTGLRIGVSTVLGLCWGMERPCVGVSSLEALAWGAAHMPEGSLICCAMDARRAEVYNAVFEIKDAAPHRLCEDRPISIADLAAELLPMGREVLLVGDGAHLCEAAFESILNCRMLTGPTLLQSAYGVCMAAFGKEAVAAKELKPVYLRISQAERERKALEKGNKI